MEPLSPREVIFYITKTSKASSYAQARLDSKVQEIARILNDNPGFINEDDVMARVLDFTRGARDLGSRSLRAKWIKETCVECETGVVELNFKPYVSNEERAQLIRNCPESLGRFDVQTKSLFFSKESLEKINEKDFWDFIQRKRVKKLVIRQNEGRSTEYEGFILKIFNERRPVLSLFLENAMLNLEDGQIEIPKAKLFLCGRYFEPELIGSFKKSDSDKPIEVSVTLDAFNTIVALIEGKENDPAAIEKKYKYEIDYLGFTTPAPIYSKLPEGCLGLELFKKLEHKLTEFTTQQWMEWLDAIEDMKKDIPSGVIFGIDSGLSIDKMALIIQDPSFGIVTKFRSYHNELKRHLGEVSASPCLFVRARHVPWGTINKSYEEQLKLFKELSEKSGHSYEPPTARETIVSECLHFMKTGERPLAGMYSYTSDEVRIGNYSSGPIIGGFTTEGLALDLNSLDKRYDTGLLPYRKFYQHSKK